LAVDVDSVARALYRPLVFQLIHWFSKSDFYSGQETILLLDNCLNLVSESSGLVRDFAAECLAEFLKYSIKQSTIQIQESSPLNAEALFNKMYSLCSHSSSSKRLAASLCFNRLYTTFREEEPLVDQFSLQLLYNFLECLRLSHRDPIGSSMFFHEIVFLILFSFPYLSSFFLICIIN